MGPRAFRGGGVGMSKTVKKEASPSAPAESSRKRRRSQDEQDDEQDARTLRQKTGLEGQTPTQDEDMSMEDDDFAPEDDEPVETTERATPTPTPAELADNAAVRAAETTAEDLTSRLLDEDSDEASDGGLTVEQRKELLDYELHSVGAESDDDEDPRFVVPGVVPGTLMDDDGDFGLPGAQQMLPPPRPGVWTDKSTVYDQKRGCKVSQISSTELSLGLWQHNAGLSRPQWESLYEVFLMTAPSTDFGEIPKTIDTIKLHTRSVLPLLPLREQAIPVRSDKQATLREGVKQRAIDDEDSEDEESEDEHGGAGQPKLKPNTRKLFFFDPIELFKRWIMSNIEMYSGMAHFVDKPVENWECRAWASQIRATSGHFAHYPATAVSGPATAAGEAPSPSGPLSAGNPSIYASGPAMAKVKLTKNVKTKGLPKEKPMAAPEVDWNQFIGVPGGPVFPSDIVRFKCNDATCDCHRAVTKEHAGRVLAVGIDKRDIRVPGNRDLPASEPKGSVVIQIQHLIGYSSLSEKLKKLIEKDGGNRAKELYMVDSSYFTHYVLEKNVRPFDLGTVPFHYSYQSNVKAEPLPASKGYFVRRVITASTLRPVWKHHPVRGELEIMEYGRRHLLESFASGRNVKSMPLIWFGDAFGLYRNMNRSLMGCYFIMAALTAQERQRNNNVLPFTLGPHGSNEQQVIEAIGPLLSMLDKGLELEINGVKILLCAFIFMCIGDMPQQQANAGMLSQQANVGDRYCYTNVEDRGDLNVDVVMAGRYHHEDARLRQYMATELTSDSAREAYGRQFGMLPEPAAIWKIMPAACKVLSFPSDPAHSEFNGLSAMLNELTTSSILTPSAVKEYAKLLSTFPFPPGWQALQSPITHLGSYTLAEHARWPVIATMLFRVWLRDEHIQEAYQKAVRAELWQIEKHLQSEANQLSQPGTRVTVPVSAIIVRAFTAVVRSNTLLMSTETTYVQRQQYQKETVAMRRIFQGLCEAGAVASIATPSQKTAPKPAQAQQSRATRARSFSQEGSQASSDKSDRETYTSVALRRKVNRPNVHIGLHYPEQIAEYGTAFNNNVFAGESKHKEHKGGITKTNHNNPERDLLMRQDLVMTVRLVLEGAYPEEPYKHITKQLQDLRRRNPRLFDSMLPRSERTRFQQLQEDKLNSGFTDIDASPSSFTAVAAGQYWKAYQVTDSLKMPVKANDRYFDLGFRNALIDAYDKDYQLRSQVAVTNTELRWFERFGFDDTAETQQRVHLHTGSFVKYREHKIGRIDRVFTHTASSSSNPKLFVLITPVLDIGYKDPVVDLNVYELARVKDRITVGLPALHPKPIWMVPVGNATGGLTAMGRGPAPSRMKAGNRVVHVDWNVKWM